MSLPDFKPCPGDSVSVDEALSGAPRGLLVSNPSIIGGIDAGHFVGHFHKVFVGPYDGPVFVRQEIMSSAFWSFCCAALFSVLASRRFFSQSSMPKKKGSIEELKSDLKSILQVGGLALNKTTFKNLETSGEIRLIRNKALADSIVAFYTSNTFVLL